MNKTKLLPRILIIDDLYGRIHPDRRNEERARLCGNYLLEDVTGDEAGQAVQTVKKPIAQVVFQRGQQPHCAVVGDRVVNDLTGAVEAVRGGWFGTAQPGWALVLLDLCFYTGHVTAASDGRARGMPEGSRGDDDPRQYFGLQVLAALHQEFPDLPVAILSSKSRDEVSREFSSRGALGFISRDEGTPEMLQEFIWRHGLIPDDTGQIVGSSKPLLLMLRAARRAALSQYNVLLRGERGAGKELFARYINRQGARLQPARPLVSVNAAAFTPELFASELFGIEQRVATGVDARRGLIESAEGGDLFFDEIKDMPPQVQAGILRVIEQREIQRVGGRETKPVNARFLSATNADIEAMVAGGTFRADLLDRLREGGVIYLPPLRERKDDLPLLVESFVQEAERLTPKARRREVAPEALAKLRDYDWPENIRGLRGCILHAVSNYPEVEYLVPVHLVLPGAQATVVKAAPIAAAVARERMDGAGEVGRGELDDLIRAMEQVEFTTVKPAALAGRLTKLKSAYYQLLARYLAAALQATSKPTPERPDGEIFISPAVKLMTGDKNLSTGEAADEVKRILRDCPEITDQLLQEAHAEALCLRPRQAKSKQPRVLPQS